MENVNKIYAASGILEASNCSVNIYVRKITHNIVTIFNIFRDVKTPKTFGKMFSD